MHDISLILFTIVVVTVVGGLTEAIVDIIKHGSDLVPESNYTKNLNRQLERVVYELDSEKNEENIFERCHVL